jgi:hypothetical protein
MQPARNGPTARVCDGLHCTHESTPLRAAARADETVSWAASTRLELGFWPASAPVSIDLPLAVHQADRSRLERPPRA